MRLFDRFSDWRWHRQRRSFLAQKRSSGHQSPAERMTTLNAHKRDRLRRGR